MLVGGVRFVETTECSEWLRYLREDSDDGGLGAGSLGYAVRPISRTDRHRPFHHPRVGWSLQDFLEEAHQDGAESFVLELRRAVAVAFTIQYPSRCT